MSDDNQEKNYLLVTECLDDGVISSDGDGDRGCLN